MKRYVILAIAMATMLFSNMAFASYTQTDYMEGTLEEVSVYNSTTSQWVVLTNTPQKVTLGSTLTFQKSMDEGLPEGTYTKLKFTFSNVFKMSGRVVIDSGANTGTYYSTSSNSGAKMKFDKTLSAPQTWTLTMGAYGPQTDVDFTTECNGSQYITTDNSINQKIDRNSGSALQLYVQKAWLWSDYGDKENFAGLGDFTTIDANTLEAAFTDGFEIDYQ